jgi:type IV secretion system protein VirB6
VNTNEFPNADGSCPSGQYVTDGDFIYKMGNQVQDKSFFSMVQDNLQDAVKLVLTLSIMFYGLKLLFGMSAVTKKELLVYILKMGVVLYFATGDAWQTMFFKGVYGASSEFANIVFKIEVDPVEIRRDGCQFGNITTPDGVTASSGRTYPAGKEYLAIWDTLDCKIMRYLGFGPEDSAANIASLIAAGFFTGPVGIYFAISVMFFGFFFIAATIRALHIFLSSALSIIIFVFISPIVIPTMLFAKTNNIFKAWATNLMSFALQPMILFAYIAIFIMVLDKSLIGSAIFVGQGPSKTISCAEVCKNADGTTVPYVGDQAPACDQQGQYTVNPLDDSVACLIAVNQFGKFPGLELFGLSIPILDNLFKANVKQRILAILKGALVMYLLCKFMDEIPTITSKLIGGTALPTASTQASGMLKSLGGTLASIQKRTTGLGKKIGRGAADYAKGKVRDAGDRGKALAGDKGSAGDKTSGPKGDIVKGQAKGDADKTSGPKGGDSSSGPKKT